MNKISASWLLSAYLDPQGAMISAGQEILRSQFGSPSVISSGVGYLVTNVLHNTWREYDNPNQLRKPPTLVDRGFQVVKGILKAGLIGPSVDRAVTAVAPYVNKVPGMATIGDGLNWVEEKCGAEQKNVIAKTIGAWIGVAVVSGVVDYAIGSLPLSLNLSQKPKEEQSVWDSVPDDAAVRKLKPGVGHMRPIPKHVWEAVQKAPPRAKQVEIPKVEEKQVKVEEPKLGWFEQFIENCKSLFSRLLRTLFTKEEGH